jgi:hypothetical protein
MAQGGKGGKKQGGGGGGWNRENYVEVADRITLFYQDHPDGIIRTEMVSLDGPFVVFKATNYRDIEEFKAGFGVTGYAYEIEGGNHVNQTSFIENAETSAIGRSLANRDYATKKNRPSAQEMEKVDRVKQQHKEDLAYIKKEFDNLTPEMYGTINNEEVNLIEFITTNGDDIAKQPRLAKQVADAVEASFAEVAESDPIDD